MCQLEPKEFFKSSDQGWSYFARFLNAIPANEDTAIALDSFLQIAGHRSYVCYRKQQEKVFLLVVGWAEGAKEAEGDVDAVKARLAKYVSSQLYLSPPEDSKIPETDDSQHIRC